MYGEAVNGLHGYFKEDSRAAAREALTVLPADRRLGIRIEEADGALLGIQYEVRNLERSRLLEKTQVSDWTQAEMCIRDRFNSAMIEQLLAMKDYDACLQFLAEKGWGDPDTPMDAEAILSRESEKTWSAVRELIRDDASVLDVLFYPNLFHNLKAAIKESVTGKSYGKVYFDDCSIDPKEMLRIIQDRDYLSLPENMRAAAQEAHETFLHTGDGQLCDIIVDRACLEAIYKAGQEAEASIIRDYAESTVAVADIKIAVRSQKTAKTLESVSYTHLDVYKRQDNPCGEGSRSEGGADA